MPVMRNDQAFEVFSEWVIFQNSLSSKLTEMNIKKLFLELFRIIPQKLIFYLCFGNFKWCPFDNLATPWLRRTGQASRGRFDWYRFTSVRFTIAKSPITSSMPEEISLIKMIVHFTCACHWRRLCEPAKTLSNFRLVTHYQTLLFKNII